MTRPNAQRLLESLRSARQEVQAQCEQVTEAAAQEPVNENLHKWFKEKWVRFGPDGKIRGDCARGNDSEGKPKCLPQSKAHALGKKGRASAAAKKRREDPNPERRGAAINVATKKKTSEATNAAQQAAIAIAMKKSGKKPHNEDQQLDEKCWDTHRQAGMKRKGDRMVPNCVPRESQEQCPECGGEMYPDTMILEKQDACYYKVKSRYKVWPSAYASGALVQCRKKGAKNWGKKTEGVAEGMSWSALDEGLSVEDKIIIFEEYMTKGNLTESLDHGKRDYFISLFKMSSTPVKDKTYIVVPLSLVGNKIMQLDAPAIMKFVGHGHDGLVFNSPNGEKTYPSKIMRDLSVFNTFTFRSQSLYDKFRTALSLKFNVSLPLVGQGKHGVAEGKMAELDMDLEDPEISDRQFEKMYGMTRKEARELFSKTNMWDFPQVRDPNKPLHEQGVAESFDQPYPMSWEKGDFGDVDALAKLDDGTNLHVMFNLADRSENDWGVEFYRGNSQSVTGQGDAQRVFATVLAAIGRFIKKQKPDRLFFTAVKEEDPTGSRAKLYDRLVQKYATGLGYELHKVDYPQQTGYKLTRKEQKVSQANKTKKPAVAEADIGGATMKRIQAGDIVKYFGEKVEVLEISPKNNFARISGGGRTLNVKLSDLKQFGRGIAEGAPELLKAEMPLIRHIEKELAQYGYEKGTPEYDEMYKHLIAMYRKFGNVDAIKQGVAEAPDDDIASNAALISGPGTTDLSTPKPTATPMAASTPTPKPTATPTATAMATPTAMAAPKAAGSVEIKDLQNKLIAAGEKIKADGIMGPRTQAALNRYNAKTTPTPTPTTPVVAAQPKPAVTPVVAAQPNPAVTPSTAAPATAVQSGSGSPIRTGSGGYVVSPDYTAASDSTSQSPYDHNLMLAAIKHRESGGDPNAVSRVGAVGTMQTMPNTLRDPGFGVKPARDNSPQELERVGKDYYAAMLKNYNNDPKVALAAYNWGPGNVNKWLKAGGDFSKLPGETRAYVKNIMGDYTTAQQAAQSAKFAAANRPSVSETRGKDQDQFGGMHQDDFQEKLMRLKQLANAGPLKTVRDPETGRTRNIPVKPKQS